MKIPGRAASHLTYCTNMHAGETWEQMFRGIRQFTLPIRDRICPGQRFGVGLWLSDRASRELYDGRRLREFRAFCEEHGLYVFTLNGFPFGNFHSRVVKEDVYRPDWREAARLHYTNRLADILSALLPPGMEGSISTVPASFKEFISGEADIRRMVENLALHALHLAGIRDMTGRLIQLGLEPEPLAFVETCDELIAFFHQHVFTHGVGFLARRTGWTEHRAFECLRMHLGMCYDTCHQAIQYEEPGEIFYKVARAGIRISKLQVSSAMKLELGDDPAAGDGWEAVLAQLERFVEPTYLHQVVERSTRGIRRHRDLDRALASIRWEAARGARAAREWRVHFHLPLFLPRAGLIGTTRDHIEKVFERLGEADTIRHLEIETYTWDVLPPAYKDMHLVEGVTREIEWVLDALVGHVYA